MPVCTCSHNLCPHPPRSYLATWERPETSILGLVGDFDSAEMAELAKQRLGDWAPSGDARSTTQQQQQQRQRQWAGSVTGPFYGAGALGSPGAAPGGVAGVQQALPPWWSPAGTDPALGLGSTGGSGTAAGTAAGTADPASPLGSWLSRGVPEADSPLGKVFVVDRPGVLQVSKKERKGCALGRELADLGRGWGAWMCITFTCAVKATFINSLSQARIALGERSLFSLQVIPPLLSTACTPTCRPALLWVSRACL